MAGLHQCPGCGYRFEDQDSLDEHEPFCVCECVVCLDPRCRGGC